MAEGKCGKATITYDESCTFACFQSPSGNEWFVTCKKPGGGTTVTGGKGREISTGVPSVHIDGPLGLAVLALSKAWGRPVSVPKEQAKKRVKRTLSGGQEEIADALGLRLGPKRKARRK